MSDTAHAIKRLRLERAWSQEHLGAVAGISARTVQRLETGQLPSLETLKALAAAFGVPVTALQAEPAGTPTTEAVPPMTDAAIAAGTTSARQRFRRHLKIYALVMVGLAALNLIRSPEHLWVVYPALGWGLALAIQARRLSRPPT